MGRRLDWEAARRAKYYRPLHTEGEIRDYKLKAKQLAERIRKGQKSRTASRHGPVRRWSPDEITGWAKAHNVGQQSPMETDDSS